MTDPTREEIEALAERFGAHIEAGGRVHGHSYAESRTMATALRQYAKSLGQEPYAHEFGRSNGDGTFSVFIERGVPKAPVADWPVTPLYAAPPALAEQPRPAEPVAAVLPADALYDRGRRDMLNAILDLNPTAAAKLAVLGGREADPYGRLPFDVVLWVTEVASQLGIEPKDASAFAAQPPASETGEANDG